MKNLILAGASLAILAAVPTAAAAQDSDTSVSVTVDYVSDYVFRGVSLADAAIQPGVEVSKGGFTAGAWFSTGVGETSNLAFDEVDLYAGYSASLSDLVGLDFGLTYYHYPEFGDVLSDSDGAGTYEVYGALSFDTVLSPAAAVYYDLTLENLTLEASIGHSVPLENNWSIDTGLTVGHVDIGESPLNYEWATASAALAYAATDSASVYLGANYSLNSEDLLGYSEALVDGAPKDNLFWFGVGIGAGF